MATPSTVLTQGFGSWGNVNLLPTLGFGIGEALILVYGPVRLEQSAVYVPGVQQASVYVPGNQQGGSN